MNKTTKILMIGLLACPTVSAEAGRKACCDPCQPVCRPASHCGGPTTKYFKAKDGTIREVMSHWEALHRAVDADNMEIELRSTQAELEATQTELTEVKSAAEARISEMEQSIAMLTAQLQKQTELADTQRKRSEKAEKTAAEGKKRIAGLRTRFEKSAKALEKATTETESLRVANAGLKKELADMVHLSDKAKQELVEAQERINAMKQAALTARKTEVPGGKKKKKKGRKPAASEATETEKPDVIEEPEEDAGDTEQVANQQAESQN